MEIATTAKLLGNRGSKFEQRGVTDKICATFSQFLDDTFEKKSQHGKCPAITRKEIKSFFKTQAPNLNLKILSSKQPCVRAQYNEAKTKIVGYELFLPFSSFKKAIKKSDPKKVGHVRHEVSHVVKNMSENSTMAHVHPTRLRADKNTKQLIFYNNILYGDEIKYFEAIEDRIISTDAVKRKTFIKGEIIEFFDKYGFNQQDKIDTLQSWRSRLDGEIVAYKDGISADTKYKFPMEELFLKLKNNMLVNLTGKGAFYDSNKYGNLEEKVDNLAGFIQKSEKNHYNHKVEDAFFLPGKLEVVESMLVDEMAKAGHDVNAWAVKNK